MDAFLRPRFLSPYIKRLSHSSIRILRLQTEHGDNERMLDSGGKKLLCNAPPWFVRS